MRRLTEPGLARVVRINRGGLTADVCMLDSGWTIPGALIGCNISSNAGDNDVPDPDPVTDPVGSQMPPGRYQIAVVVPVSGMPVIMCFIKPSICEMMFSDKRAIHRYGSDVYTSVDDDGNCEIYHPSGIYLRIGENPDHEDLTGKDDAGQFELRRNLTRKPYITIQGLGNAALQFDPDGNLSVSGVKQLSLAGQTISGQADTVMTFKAAGFIFDGAVQCTQTISSDVDVTVGPVSLVQHGHLVTTNTGIAPSQQPVGGGISAGSFGNFGNQDAPRGLRNNNPGNLKAIAGQPFQGQTGVDADGFAIFSSPYYGVRALAVDLANQQQIHGLNTVQDIITKYAPESDGNDTQAYIDAVASALNVSPTDPLEMTDPTTLTTFVQSVMTQENGPNASAFFTMAALPSVPQAAGYIPIPSLTGISTAVQSAISAVS